MDGVRPRRANVSRPERVLSLGGGFRFDVEKPPAQCGSTLSRDSASTQRNALDRSGVLWPGVPPVYIRPFICQVSVLRSHREPRGYPPASTARALDVHYWSNIRSGWSR